MQTTQARANVDIDTRRAVFMIAQARKPNDVTKQPHEAFIRNLLKDRLGWRRDEAAPESIKAVAKQMAEQFIARDKARYAAEQKAKETAEAN
jgi:hypothetical protein